MKNGILQRLNEDSKLTEACLEDLLAGGDEKYNSLFESCRYSVFAGGKRIRPFLAIEFCRMLGGSDGAVLPFAAAIEMIHTYSLIHDDLPCMDNDTMRRGKPTNHVVYGEAPALLAGDALLTWAFEAAASNEAVDYRSRVEAVKLLSKNAGIRGMVGGQMIDLIGETERHDRQTLEYMHSKKTGALIEASCLLGCIAAGAGEEDFKNAKRYAKGIGLSFQIIDDILDKTGDETKLGKHIGKDEASGKTTFMSYMSVEEAKETAKEHTAKALEAIAGYEQNEYLSQLGSYLLERDK